MTNEEKLREALLRVADKRQFGPCWCYTVDRTYCVGQPRCQEARAALASPAAPEDRSGWVEHICSDPTHNHPPGVKCWSAPPAAPPSLTLTEEERAQEVENMVRVKAFLASILRAPSVGSGVHDAFDSAVRTLALLRGVSRCERCGHGYRGRAHECLPGEPECKCRRPAHYGTLPDDNCAICSGTGYVGRKRPKPRPPPTSDPALATARAEGRAEALEAAARVADKWAEQQTPEMSDYPRALYEQVRLLDRAAAERSRNIATDIRGLKP